MRPRLAGTLMALVAVLLLTPPAFAQERRTPQTAHYRDGSRTIKLTIAPHLVFDERQNKVVPAERSPPGQEESVQAASAASSTEPDILVFVTDTGEKLVAVGGVVLVLDGKWTEEECEAFLVRHEIEDEVTSLSSKNGYLVRTEPGLAALELANRLVSLRGVLISSPDWWRELKER